MEQYRLSEYIDRASALMLGALLMIWRVASMPFKSGMATSTMIVSDDISCASLNIPSLSQPRQSLSYLFLSQASSAGLGAQSCGRQLGELVYSPHFCFQLYVCLSGAVRVT